MYKSLKRDFPKIKKKIENVIGKLEKYNLKYNFEIIGEYIEQVDIPLDYQHEKITTVFLEVIHYNFSMETIKIGNYNIIAILKHNQIENSRENLIYMVDKEVKLPIKYNNIDSNCDHCNTNRKRNTTIILENLEKPGELLQVGSTCLKDYTGIEEMDIVSEISNLQDMFMQGLTNYDSIDYRQSYVKTIDYLVNCIYLIEKEGYTKDYTKDKAFDLTLRGLAIKAGEKGKYVTKALDTISYFNKDFNDNDFLRNTSLLLKNEYNKNSGFIAYAYLAYLKELEKKTSRNKNIEELSNYVGNIGDRIEIEVKLLNRYIFQTMYGPQQIYVFIDNNNNVYKWKTSVYLVNSKGESIETNEDTIKLKGSIKGHEEYKGTKQTELTRCKIIN